MDQDRNQIREIEDARERVARDVRSVAENANVVERTKESVQGRVDDAKSMMQRQLHMARERLEDARDTMQNSMKNMRINMPNMPNMPNMRNMDPRQNPMGWLIAGAAVGFLIGLMVPVTQFERKRLGPAAMHGAQTARHGAEVIKETIGATLS